MSVREGKEEEAGAGLKRGGATNGESQVPVDDGKPWVDDGRAPMAMMTQVSWTPSLFD